MSFGIFKNFVDNTLSNKLNIISAPFPLSRKIESPLSRKIESTVLKTSIPNVSITTTAGKLIEFTVEIKLGYDDLSTYVDVADIKDVKLGANIDEILPGAFYMSFNLSSIIFTDDSNVKFIGERAFENTSLTSILIPSTTQNIGNFAFRNIPTLEHILVDSNNKNYSSNEGILYNIDRSTIVKYPEGKRADPIILDKSIKKIGVGSLEKLSSKYSQLFLPYGLKTISQNAFVGYSYGSISEKLKLSLIIPTSTVDILAGAFKSIQLDTLITHSDITYGDLSFKNSTIGSIYILSSDGNRFLRGEIKNHKIITTEPKVAISLNEFLSTKNNISVNNLIRYGYINYDQFIASINANNALMGKYINFHYVESKQATSNHYMNLVYNYGNESSINDQVLWTSFNNGISKTKGILTYQKEGVYGVSSQEHKAWLGSKYSIADTGNEVTISDHKGDLSLKNAVFTKVSKFPAINTLDNGLYKYNDSLLLVKNNVIKNYSTNTLYNFDESTDNYTSSDEDLYYRVLMGTEDFKQYYIENEKDKIYSANNIKYLQELFGAGSLDAISDKIPTRTGDGGFTMSVLKNETMSTGEQAYMTICNRFSTSEISHLTNLIKYVLTFEVDEMNGPPGFFYASIKTFINKTDVFYSMEKNSIPSIGTYTMTFLTQKNSVKKFNSEQICIEAIGNVSSDVNISVSSCSLDVQIYDENIQDYYIGNSLILEEGEYTYTDVVSSLFFCYKMDNNNYLLLNNTKDTYMFSTEFGVYINVNDDRLYFICNSEYIENATNKKFQYTLSNNSISSSILNTYFTNIGNYIKNKSILYVSNKMTLTDLLFYNKIFEKSVSIFSDRYALTNILSLLNKFININKTSADTYIIISEADFDSEAQKIKNELAATYIPFKLLKSVDDNSISYWNINSDQGISLSVDSDVNNDGFIGQYIIEVFIQ